MRPKPGVVIFGPQNLLLSLVVQFLFCDYDLLCTTLLFVDWGKCDVGLSFFYSCGR